jgi:hypothetical protein
MKFLMIPLALAMLTAPSFAQKYGSINSNAPVVTSSIAMGDAKVAVEFHAISLGQGRAWTALGEKSEAGTRARTRANNNKNPLGSATLSTDMTVAGAAIPAGTYDLFFRVDEELNWHLVFAVKGGDAQHKVALNLTPSPEHKSARLMLSLQAGEKDGTATMWVAFGDKNGTLELAKSGNGAKPEKAEKGM